MKLTTPFAGPCTCTCHDSKDTPCQSAPCCHYTNMARHVATEAARHACERWLDGDKVLSVIEIDGHEHNLVALSKLTEDNRIKTLLKLAELTLDAEERVNREFMPAMHTILECCASVGLVQELIMQSLEFRTIASVRAV